MNKLKSKLKDNYVWLLLLLPLAVYFYFGLVLPGPCLLKPELLQAAFYCIFRAAAGIWGVAGPYAKADKLIGYGPADPCCGGRGALKGASVRVYSNRCLPGVVL